MGKGMRCQRSLMVAIVHISYVLQSTHATSSSIIYLSNPNLYGLNCFDHSNDTLSYCVCEANF